jgi:hypothetical protein
MAISTKEIGETYKTEYEYSKEHLSTRLLEKDVSNAA